MSKEKGRDHSYRSLTRAMAAMTAFSVLAGLAVAGRAAAQAPGVDQATAATVAQPADAAAESLTEQIKQAEGAARVEKARALLAFLAANHDAIGRDTFARAMWRIFIALRAQPADAAAFTILREDLEAIIARLRATGNGEAELRFAVWLEYLVPEDARLGIARMVHRRAAALGMLTGDIARKARGSIADHARRLRKEGRIEEALRALEDTFAELAAAGLERSAASRSELRLYAEVLTQMRRDAEADSLFAHLIETAPEGSAEQCLAINQAAYYRNLVGRFAAAETPGLQAAECAERLYGRKAISTQKARFNYAMALLGQGQAAKALPFLEEALPLQLAREADPFDFSDAEADTIILLTALARARAQLPGHERAALES
ncbi:MAG: hypothetical protein N2423_07650, partial [Novosphingobium sp.]|nr:hypothetical protein [Novosphingobium sp.]